MGDELKIAIVVKLFIIEQQFKKLAAMLSLVFVFTFFYIADFVLATILSLCS